MAGQHPGVFKSVASAVHEIYGVELRDITGPSRVVGVCHPRQEATLAVREMSGLSWSAIARLFKRKSHKSITHGVRSLQAREGYRERVDAIKSLAYQKINPL